MSHQPTRIAAFDLVDNSRMTDAGDGIPIETSYSAAYVFGPFRLLVAERALFSAGHPVAVGGRALDLLLLLLENAGELVRKEALIARAWPGTHVEEATLRVQIASLRRALGDGRGELRYIQNESGRGYRFVAAVTQEAGKPFLSQLDAVLSEGHPSPLPMPISRIIGRDEIIASLAAQLPERRFLSLVGLGGIGKTTVALAVAHRLAAGYRDGVCLVDLAPLDHSAAIPAAIANALMLPDYSSCKSLLAFLRDKHMLILLDNCEHLIGGAARAAEMLLGAAPHVHLLTTSREPLRADGEWVHRLPMLDVPPGDVALSAQEALSYPAVALFVERASACAGFEFGEEDVAGIVALCRKLRGCTLSIQLAAANIDVFGLSELIAGGAERLELLSCGRRTAPPRQQTIRASLDWSYRLLRPVEKIVLYRLAACARPFGLGLAVALASCEEISPDDVIEALAELAAKSMILPSLVDGQVLYRLPEVSHGYVRRKANEVALLLKERRAPSPAHQGWTPGRLRVLDGEK
ncbi:MULTISPECIES: winged helix-turn-helix domain-containing protein [Rhodomicrobium]|uniref:ATP-binding protein n=1 Tax=Rhodomicrobium TaxID=1068 RepID=UPI00148218AE|nr:MULTISPECIES: winged helix-turn-helix domain-containing protein [Rhodomicrobium]